MTRPNWPQRTHDFFCRVLEKRLRAGGFEANGVFIPRSARLVECYVYSRAQDPNPTVPSVGQGLMVCDSYRRWLDARACASAPAHRGHRHTGFSGPLPVLAQHPLFTLQADPNRDFEPCQMRSTTRVLVVLIASPETCRRDLPGSPRPTD